MANGLETDDAGGAIGRVQSPRISGYRPWSPGSGGPPQHRGRHVSMDKQRRVSTLAAFVRRSAIASVMEAARDGSNGGLMLDEPPPPLQSPSLLPGLGVGSEESSPSLSRTKTGESPTAQLAAIAAAVSAQAHALDPSPYRALILKHGRMKYILRTGEAVGEVEMLQNLNRCSTAVCHADATLIRISRSDYFNAIHAIQEVELDGVAAFIAGIPPIAAAKLNRDVLLRVVYALRPLHLLRGEMVFAAGTAARGVYFVQEGAVHITAPSFGAEGEERDERDWLLEVDVAAELRTPKGKEGMVLAVLGTSTFFGEEPLLQHDLATLEVLKGADVDSTAAAAAAASVSRTLRMPYGAVAAKESRVFVLDREHMSHGAGAELLAALRGCSCMRWEFRKSRAELAAEAKATEAAGGSGVEAKERRVLDRDIKWRVESARKAAFLGIPLASISPHDKIGGGRVRGKETNVRAEITASHVGSRGAVIEGTTDRGAPELTLEAVLRRVRTLTGEEDRGMNVSGNGAGGGGVGGRGGEMMQRSTGGRRAGSTASAGSSGGTYSPHPLSATEVGGFAHLLGLGDWEVRPENFSHRAPDVIRPAMTPRPTTSTDSTVLGALPHRKKRPTSAIGIYAGDTWGGGSPGAWSAQGKKMGAATAAAVRDTAGTSTSASASTSMVVPYSSPRAAPHSAWGSHRAARLESIVGASSTRNAAAGFDKGTLHMEHPTVAAAAAVQASLVVAQLDTRWRGSEKHPRRAEIDGGERRGKGSGERERGEEDSGDAAAAACLGATTCGFPCRAVQRTSRAGMAAATRIEAPSASRRRS